MAPEKKYKMSQNFADERVAVAAEEEREPDRNAPIIVQAARNTAFMDPELWGQLQYYGDGDLLENVYTRLPLEEFYELRGVCKAWYGIARNRMALDEQIHKPFFNLCTRGDRFPTRLCGILTFNKFHLLPSSASTSEPPTETKPSWVWTRRGNRPLGYYVSSSYQSFANESLVCSHDIGRYGRRLFSESAVDVLDWNISEYLPGPMRSSRRTRPVGEVPYNGPEHMVMGMMVLPKAQNEWLHPFRIVLGSLEYGTQVFTSDRGLGSWVTKPCRPTVRGVLRHTTGCASRNGRVYITMEFSREILVYIFNNGSWSSIDAPGGSAHSPVSMLPQHYRNDTLGAWSGRLVDVVDDTASLSLTLWELVDDTTSEWTVFERMPTDLYRGWLKSEDGTNDIADFTIHGSFCGDYVLVYSWIFKFERAHRFCLFNMATKLWQQLDVDGNTVFIKKSGTVEWYGW